jgi:hypothetical protein
MIAQLQQTREKQQGVGLVGPGGVAALPSYGLAAGTAGGGGMMVGGTAGRAAAGQDENEYDSDEEDGAC